MKTLVIATLILLAAALAAQDAAALEATAPSPEQAGAAPSMAEPRESPAIWQFLTVPQARARQCYVTAWSLVQGWYRDHFGQNIFWWRYVPASYACY